MNILFISYLIILCSQVPSTSLFLSLASRQTYKSPKKTHANSFPLTTAVVLSAWHEAPYLCCSFVQKIAAVDLFESNKIWHKEFLLFVFQKLFNRLRCQKNHGEGFCKSVVSSWYITSSSIIMSKFNFLSWINRTMFVLGMDLVRRQLEPACFSIPRYNMHTGTW